MSESHITEAIRITRRFGQLSNHRVTRASLTLASELERLQTWEKGQKVRLQLALENLEIAKQFVLLALFNPQTGEPDEAR